MFRTATVSAVAALCLSATAALACPNWQAPPNFGTSNLSAGFLPDPHTISLTAGGNIDVSTCLNGTVGYVTAAPDFDLNWSGSSSRLTIHVESNADTVLLVNDPNGNWLFNDDWNGLNPGLVIQNPAQGLYDIWVGTFSPNSNSPARLHITELN